MPSIPTPAEDLLAIVDNELALLEVARLDLNEQCVECFFDTDQYYTLVRQRAENVGAWLALSKMKDRLEALVR